MVHELAADNGLSLEYIKDEELTTLMAVQPKDLLTEEETDTIRLENFFDALVEMRSESPVPIHIEVLSDYSVLPFRITKNLPDIKHWIRISTLE